MRACGEADLSIVVIDLLLILGLAAGLLHGRIGTARTFALFILAVIITGRIPFEEAIPRITSPAIIAVVSLVVVSSALAKLPGIGRVLFGRLKKGTGVRRLLARFLGATALVSSVTPNTAVVGALMGPASRRRDASSHQLLLPLSYMSLAGGMLTPFGTSASLMVVAEAARHGFNLNVLDFTAPGIFVVVGVFLCLALISPWLLKPKTSSDEPEAEFFYIEGRIDAGSPMIGRTVEQNRLRHLQSFFLAEIVRGEQIITPVTPRQRIAEGDRLIFVGDISDVDELHALGGLTLDAAPRSDSIGELFHAVIASESVLVGRTLREVDFRPRFDASVVAIRRGEERLSGKLGDIRLKAGDELILAAGADFRSRTNLRANLHILEVDQPGQAPLSTRSTLALLGCFAVFLGAALTQIVPFSLIALLFAGLVVLAGWVAPREARRIFPFELIIVLWGAILLSEMIRSSGVAGFAADFIAGYASGLPPVAALAAVFLLAWGMTELFSNASAALTAFPVALEVADRLALSPEAFILATAFGASASFLMPFGYQTHLMVMTPGRYSLAHFLRLGGVVFVVYATITLTALSLIHF